METDTIQSKLSTKKSEKEQIDPKKFRARRKILADFKVNQYGQYFYISREACEKFTRIETKTDW